MDWFPIHFIRPAWLLALPLCVLLPWLWRHLRRPSGDWSRVCDPHLLKWLSVGEPSRKPGKLGGISAGLVLALTTLALSGPSWHQLPDVSFSAQDSRVMVLDLSQSMLAEDLKPNRLTRARFRLSDILRETREGQVGMVAYAGDAYVVSPLTSDTNTIANMLPALAPDVIPVAGSRADRALELAAELLQRSGQAGGEILLVTDDVEDGDVDIVARLSRQGIVTSVLAVGTDKGAPIPSGNGFVSDAQGNVVISRVGLSRLQAMASAGRGRLSTLDSSLTNSSPWLSAGGNEFAQSDEGIGERWRDSGPWLVLLLLPLVAFGFRRGVLFFMPMLVLPALLQSQSVQASVWDDLWKRSDQQAQEALQQDEPGRAASLARDPGIEGEAWYRSGEYERAHEAWSRTEGAESHYNRGNALANAGNLDGAIAAYDEALALSPDMEDAEFNKAIVEQLKQQQEQESESESENDEQQDGESSDSEQQGDSEEQAGDEQGEGEPQESEQGEGNEEQQAQEQMAQAWTEEDAQAMEQWLRRIPDDPGGLLRRKFRNEHQRRGAPPEESKTW